MVETLPLNGPYSPTWVQDDFGKHVYKHKTENEPRNGLLLKQQEFQEHLGLVDSIKACIKHKNLYRGKQIHAEVLQEGLLHRNVYLGTALITMYARFGQVSKSREVFDELRVRNVVSFNALITGYVRLGLAHEALECFHQMRTHGIPPNDVTFICILKACGLIGSTLVGAEIHAEINKLGLIGKNAMVSTALVDMYAKCGDLDKAQEVFDGSSERDLISWTALIAAYAYRGRGHMALDLFARMQEGGVSPNPITFACVLKACGHMRFISKGEQIHAHIASRKGNLDLGEHKVTLGNALVDMYAKCGMVGKAHRTFDQLPAKDIVTWNILVTAYAHHEHGDEALKCFSQMQNEGFLPDVVTFSSVLKACSDVGSLEKGEEIHMEVRKQGLLENSTVIGNALVDMYAKCGVLRKAQEVFEGLPAPDAISWTTLITGYAQLGRVRNAFDQFRKMLAQGIMPDIVTFLVLLTACSHAGLVEEGQIYLDSMMNTYCLSPTLEHFTCMVDLFTRAGHFDRAIIIIEKVPPCDCLELWLVLLGACRKWINIELGRWAFENAVQLDENNGSLYVCMSDIYAAAGMQEEIAKIEALRMRNGVWNIPGHSLWTIDGG